MKTIILQNKFAFTKKLREIEEEMLEDYEEEYASDNGGPYRTQALYLLLEVKEYLNLLLPSFRKISCMLEQLFFVADTGETRYLAALEQRLAFAYMMLDKIEPYQRLKTIQYAARWIEYYYRVYEKESTKAAERERVDKVFAEIEAMAAKKMSAEEFKKKKKPLPQKKSAYPLRLYQHLDGYVVGQDEVKKTIAMAVHHYINYGIRNNVMMIGPSGSGKNYVMQILSEFEELKKEMVVYVHDASQITPNGYRGGDISDIFQGFVKMCKMKGRSSEKGIIYLDEIDKIIYPNTDSNNENLNANIQRQLLSALAGTLVVEGVDTSKILFILGGAFEELYALERQKEKEKKHTMGFYAAKEPQEETGEESNLRDMLMSLGAQKEFLGRITSIARMEKLGKEELKKILLHEKTGVITEKQELYARDGLELAIEEDVYDFLVEKMWKEDLGARSVRNVMEEVLKNYNFDMLIHGYQKMTIHKGMFTNQEKPYFEGGKKDEKKNRNVGRLKPAQVGRLAASGV